MEIAIIIILAYFVIKLIESQWRRMTFILLGILCVLSVLIVATGITATIVRPYIPLEVDEELTPGKFDMLNFDLSNDPCSHSTKFRRNVSEKTKKAVLAAYIAKEPRFKICETKGMCEIDHRVPLELLGTNDMENLWPEPYEGPHGAHEKDKVENYLHNEVCHSRMSLQVAQSEILGDWEKLYDDLKAEGKIK